MMSPLLIVLSKAVWCCRITPLWLKLSNSGDILKLIVLSYIRKIICGWNNSPGKVTSYKMIENEMDYRGSKSELFPFTNSVKEQRVDGSWCCPKDVLAKHLRCTLMGFEINYQIKILSNQLNTRFYSTAQIQSKIKIMPWLITGFTDAEGSFSISIQKNLKLKIGIRVIPTVVITLNERAAKPVNYYCCGSTRIFWRHRYNS